MLSVPSEPLSVSASLLFYIGDFPVTNTVAMAVVNFIVIILFCIAASRFRVKNPGKFQLFIEDLVQLIVNLIGQVAGDAKVAWRVVPLVGSLIFFIMISNLIMSIIPFFTGLTFENVNGETVALFRSHTNDFNTTLSLAFGMVILTQIFSIQKKNIFGYIFSFIKIPNIINGFKKGIGGGLMGIMDFLIGFLDIVSEIAKIASLSLRLFGNMFAGELLIGVLMTIFAPLLPIPIIALSLLSGAIQSVVFGSLVTSFFAGVMKDE